MIFRFNTGSFGPCACNSCGHMFIDGEECFVCPDCGGLFCSECNANGAFKNHKCQEDEIEE